MLLENDQQSCGWHRCQTNHQCAETRYRCHDDPAYHKLCNWQWYELLWGSYAGRLHWRLWTCCDKDLFLCHIDWAASPCPGWRWTDSDRIDGWNFWSDRVCQRSGSRGNRRSQCSSWKPGCFGKQSRTVSDRLRGRNFRWSRFSERTSWKYRLSRWYWHRRRRCRAGPFDDDSQR